MTLIEDVRAPNPRRVRIFLAEKGLEVPGEPVEIMKLAHKSDALRAKNPWALLPVLELDDGTAISETIAICRYFEALHPEPPLMGEGPLGLAQVEMWQRRVEFHLFLPVVHSVRHLHPRFDVLEVPQVPDWGRANKPRVADALAILDARLGESRFIAGDAFTVADITAIAAAEFMRIARIEAPAELANFHRWREEAFARPSVTGAA